jgi:hypothetical protein
MISRNQANLGRCASLCSGSNERSLNEKPGQWESPCAMRRGQKIALPVNHRRRAMPGVRAVDSNEVCAGAVGIKLLGRQQ